MQQFVAAFDHFYKTGEKNELIHFIEKTLEQYVWKSVRRIFYW
ncbi:Nucleotidyltransferase [Bacillus thuringiensis serovar israelensis ATCC 35646]|nr:Nucleotidyltransferase [Bacillus thuringiensis serovar israelensis ATCC 35646]